MFSGVAPRAASSFTRERSLVRNQARPCRNTRPPTGDRVISIATVSVERGGAALRAPGHDGRTDGGADVAPGLSTASEPVCRRRGTGAGAGLRRPDAAVAVDVRPH